MLAGVLGMNRILHLLAWVLIPLVCAVVVVVTYEATHRAFLVAKQNAALEKNEKWLQRQKQCADMWPLRGINFYDCLGDNDVEAR